MSAADRLNEIEARADGITLLPVSYRSLAEHIARTHIDIAALVAALRAVLDLHRESRNDVNHTPPCEHCHGEPGVHECGCWADEKWPTVCAVCMEGTKGASVAWPCPTVRAIEEALS